MLEVRASWFGNSAPQNCKGSSITIGSGVDGQVTVASTTVMGNEANNKYTLEVVSAVGNNKPMAVAFVNNKITVTLGTDGAGALDNAKNTAILVGAAINALVDFSATHSGSGADAMGITSLCASVPNLGGIVANSFVDVSYITPGEAGNNLIIAVEDGVQNGALGVAFANDILTITLGMNGDNPAVPDDAKNTATLIAAAIDALPDFTAVADGTGVGVPGISDGNEIQFIGGTDGVIDLTGGQYGTESPEPMVVVRVWNAPVWDYYVNIAPNGKYDANWRMFNLLDY